MPQKLGELGKALQSKSFTWMPASTRQHLVLLMIECEYIANGNATLRWRYILAITLPIFYLPRQISSYRSWRGF
jgi:hypothetical protein